MVNNNAANLMSPSSLAVPPVGDERFGGKVVEGFTAEKLRDKTLKVIRVNAAGPNLFVTVLGPSAEAVTEGPARRLAYDERIKHGFENAGVENAGILMTVNVEEIIEKGADAIDQIPTDRIKAIDADNLRFCAVYKLTRGI